MMLELKRQTMLGKIVKVIIDRPLGSYHPTHKNIYYSVNYGYVPNVIACDSEEQDAYVLGVDTPLSEFVGVVIAVIHRKNDNEDKWVVTPKNVIFTRKEILQAVYFQEKYFDIEIET